MPLTISDYYRNAVEQMEAEVDATPDDRVLGTDPDAWANYLIKKWGMEEVVLDDSRDVGMAEIETERRLRGYDIYAEAEAAHKRRELSAKGWEG